MRVLFAPLLAALLLAPPAAARAADLPLLPGEALGDDVVGVLWIDAQQVDPARLAAAVDRTMGRYARAVNEALAPYARLHAPFLRAGGTSLAIIYFDPYSANSATRGVANPVFLFSMKDGANRAAIESIATSASVVIDPQTKVAAKSTAKFEMMGDWLMAFDGALAQPWMEKGDKDRMEALRAALRPIKDHPAALAFVPSKRMRAAYAEKVGLDPHTPKDLLNFVRTLIECKSLSITAALGESPAIEASLLMPDTETASQLVSLNKDMLETLGGFMKKRDMRGTRIELITQIASYFSVFSNNVMQQEGNAISAASNGRRITATAEGIGDGLALARQEALIVRSLNQMQALIVALNSYARDNRGQYPLRLSDLKNLSYVKDYDKLVDNPHTGDNPGYIYIRPQRSLNDLVKTRAAAQTPILYESRGGRIYPNVLIGYANAQVGRVDLPE
jgi:hypothetical protein